MSAGRFLRPRQVVDKVGLCWTKVQKLEKEGRFPQSTKIDSAKVFSEAEIDRWMDAKLAERPNADHAQ